MTGCGKGQCGAKRKRQRQAEQACQWQDWKPAGMQAGEMQGDALVPERVCLGSQRHDQGVQAKRSH